MSKLKQLKGNIVPVTSGGRGSAGSRVRRGCSCANANEFNSSVSVVFSPLVEPVRAETETQSSTPSRQSSRDRRLPTNLASGEFVVADAASRLHGTQTDFRSLDIRANDYLVEYKDDDDEADNNNNEADNDAYDEEESESDEEVKRKGFVLRFVRGFRV